MNRNLKRTLAITLFLFLGTHAAVNHANEGAFSLKGGALGAEESVCGSAKVTRQQETLEAIGVTGYNFPASGCALHFDTIAGVAPSGPARLLFWKGRLIRMIVEFESLDISNAAALRTAFIDLNGKPGVEKKRPFRFDTWRRGASTLQLEWVDGAALHNVGAYLTDSKGWAEYEKSRAQANKLVEAMDKKRRSQDLR